MKRLSAFFRISLLIAVMSLFVNVATAQTPGGVPDDPSLPSNGTGTNDAVGHPTSGGSADIGSGIVILLSLVGAYGGYRIWKKKEE